MYLAPCRSNASDEILVDFKGFGIDYKALSLSISVVHKELRDGVRCRTYYENHETD